MSTTVSILLVTSTFTEMSSILVVVERHSRLTGERLQRPLAARSLDSQLLLGELLPAALVLVEGGKVVADDGDGEGDDEDAADGAARADHLAEARRRADVAVADLGR